MESWESLIGARIVAHGAVKTCRIEDAGKRCQAFYKKSDKYKAQRKGADKRYREAHKAKRNEASRLWRLAHPDYHKNYKPKPKEA